jgi:hypothetical protein
MPPLEPQDLRGYPCAIEKRESCDGVSAGVLYRGDEPERKRDVGNLKERGRKENNMEDESVVVGRK